MDTLNKLLDAREAELDAMITAQINDDDAAFERHRIKVKQLSDQIIDLQKAEREEEERVSRLDLAEREFQQKAENDQNNLKLREKQGNKDLVASFGRTAFGAVCTAGLTWMLKDVEKESILSAKPFGFVSDFKKKFM